MQFKHVMRGLDPRISSLVADGRIKSGHDGVDGPSTASMCQTGGC
jgi:hypothetical protein